MVRVPLTTAGACVVRGRLKMPGIVIPVQAFLAVEAWPLQAAAKCPGDLAVAFEI